MNNLQSDLGLLYTRKRYALVSGLTKCLTEIDGKLEGVKFALLF